MRATEGYDEQAVAWIAALEQRLGRLRLERFGAFVAVLNALEYHVEGEGRPSVVRHLGDALLAIAAEHRWPVDIIKDITQTVGFLHSHVEAQQRR